MYNRYIPQPDGTHKRKKTFEQTNHAIPSQANFSHIEKICEKDNPHSQQDNEKNHVIFEPRKRNVQRQKVNQRTNSFLQNILPRELDAGDLIIIILLLLVSGDCPDEQNNALLTLAIYLFM